jgi:hypothetical protein
MFSQPTFLVVGAEQIDLWTLEGGELDHSKLLYRATSAHRICAVLCSAKVAGGAEMVAVVEGHILVIIDPTAELEFSSAPPPPPSAPSAAETVLEDEAREKEVYIEALPRCAGGAGPQG